MLGVTVAATGPVEVNAGRFLSGAAVVQQAVDQRSGAAYARRRHDEQAGEPGGEQPGAGEHHESSASILATRAAWRPPPNSVVRKVFAMSAANRAPMSVPPRVSTLALLCSRALPAVVMS